MLADLAGTNVARSATTTSSNVTSTYITGSRAPTPNSRLDKTRETHQRRNFGHILVESLRAASITRFIHVSSAFLFRDGGLLINVFANTLFRNVTVDSRDCETEMAQPDLAWTIVRPPQLFNHPPTGRIRILAGHLPKGGRAIFRADVAAFMLQEAVTPASSARS